MSSVLNSLPLYYFSLFRAPKKVTYLLDSIRPRFLWGGGIDKWKIFWVSWSVVTKPKDKYGLGVGFLNSLNLSILAKWWWRLESKEKDL